MPPMVKLLMVPALAAGTRAGTACAKRPQQHVHNALRGFDVAAGDRRRRERIHDAADGSMQSERPQDSRRRGRILS